MNAITPIRREFLFLQGPPGPFFRLLADALREHGLGVHRINLSGGDRYDWSHGSTTIAERSAAGRWHSTGSYAPMA